MGKPVVDFPVIIELFANSCGWVTNRNLKLGVFWKVGWATLVHISRWKERHRPTIVGVRKTEALSFIWCQNMNWLFSFRHSDHARNCVWRTCRPKIALCNSGSHAMKINCHQCPRIILAVLNFCLSQLITFVLPLHWLLHNDYTWILYFYTSLIHCSSYL